MSPGWVQGHSPSSVAKVELRSGRGGHCSANPLVSKDRPCHMHDRAQTTGSCRPQGRTVHVAHWAAGFAASALSLLWQSHLLLSQPPPGALDC